MDKLNTINILKKAFLMEQRGKTLYETARDHAENEEVKTFFQELVEDEKKHMKILERQFKAVNVSGQFTVQDYDTMGIDPDNQDHSDILDNTIINKINAASFEATAITAAVNFEQKAVTIYAERAKETNDPEEKKVYNWLSLWEETHLKKLMALQESLMAKIWDDNSFWPL
jgi:rubrerythrin